MCCGEDLAGEAGTGGAPAPSARAAGMGSARGRARSGAWRGTAAHQDELTPLPAEGLRATTPEDGAAAPGLAGPRVLSSPRLCHPGAWPDPAGSHQPRVAGSDPREPFSQPRCGYLAAWYHNPHSPVFPSQKNKHEPFSRTPGNWHGNLPAPAPASPRHPGTAPPHTTAKGDPRHWVAEASCPLALPR